MQTLDQIGCDEGTDRASNGWHDYLCTYDSILGHLRHQPITLLEMGVLGGRGVKTWSRWLTHPHAHIVGIDIELNRYQGCSDPRVTCFQGDQTDQKFMDALSDVPWSVIIDDAGHFGLAQIECFKFMWLQIASQGYYCIEDLHTFKSPQHSSGANILHYLCGLAEQLQAVWPDERAIRKPTDTWDIDWILIRKGLCIIKKL